MATQAKRRHVGTKGLSASTFGNDSGFIRVRRRKLKGGDPSRRAFHEANGTLVTEATSFDLVRAVRVNGKPRHQFVLGLGSLKNVTRRDTDLVWFWLNAVRKLNRHGIGRRRQRDLLQEISHKGAPLPTAAQWQRAKEGGLWQRLGWTDSKLRTVMGWLQ